MSENSEIVRARDVEALAYARGVLQRMRHEDIEFFGVSLNLLEKRDNRRFAIEMAKLFALGRAENLMDTVDMARAGWGLADEALRELILDHLNRGKVMPTYLAAYSMEVVGKRAAQQRGKQKADYFLRDMAILVAIILVMEKFNLAPTSRDGKNTCACSVVADAMALSYKAVEAIWSKYGRIAVPDQST